VGVELGRRIAHKFTTVQAMANAPRETWNEIKGLGEKKAAEAYLFFRERR
jgi:ERCC4-type nuclease